MNDATDRVQLEDWLIDHRWPDAYDLSHAIVSSDWYVNCLAEVRAEGVNDGIRLAAQLVRDHVLGGSGVRVADFLTSRADRARAAEQVDNG